MKKLTLLSLLTLTLSSLLNASLEQEEEIIQIVCEFGLNGILIVKEKEYHWLEVKVDSKYAEVLGEKICYDLTQICNDSLAFRTDDFIRTINKLSSIENYILKSPTYYNLVILDTIKRVRLVLTTKMLINDSGSISLIEENGEKDYLHAHIQFVSQTPSDVEDLIIQYFKENDIQFHDEWYRLKSTPSHLKSINMLKMREINRLFLRLAETNVYESVNLNALKLFLSLDGRLENVKPNDVRYFKQIMGKHVNGFKSELFNIRRLSAGHLHVMVKYSSDEKCTRNPLLSSCL